MTYGIYVWHAYVRATDVEGPHARAGLPVSKGDDAHARRRMQMQKPASRPCGSSRSLFLMRSMCRAACSCCAPCVAALPHVPAACIHVLLPSLMCPQHAALGLNSSLPCGGSPGLLALSLALAGHVVSSPRVEPTRASTYSCRFLQF